MSSIRPIIRAKNTILFKFSVGLTLLLLVMIMATYVVVDLVAKGALISKNKELIEETGLHIVSEISQHISIAENLTQNLAAAGESLPKDPKVFSQVIPHILNTQEQADFILGGGIWPEPNKFTSGVSRRSFFWGRDKQGELQYFDQYNNINGSGYHKKEWYVPSRYSSKNQCLWSNSYMDPYTLSPMVTCTVAMFEKQEFIGNATVDVSLQRLKHILTKGSEKLGGYAYAVDRNNKFLSFPDESLASAQSSENEHSIKEYISVNQLAEKVKLFQPIATILSEINQSLTESLTEQDRVVALDISSNSQHISPLDAQLTVANMAILSGESSHLDINTISMINQHDYLLDKAANVSVFIIPKTLWKIVVVTPQQVVISSASEVANLILILLIAIMIVGAFLGFIYFRRSLILPIYQMVTQLRNKDSDFTQKALLNDRRQDEFGWLAYHFNQSTMALDHKNQDLELQIKERNQAEKQLQHLAHHDPLTGLPNRLLFQDRLQQAISHSKARKQKFAVFFMDLDNFKIVNDSMGHEVGDELLKQVAIRLSSEVNIKDTVARLGGDEFAFIINNISTVQDGVRIAKRINTSLKTPISVNGNYINVGCSIGITIFPDDAGDSEQLLRNADIAMYQSKNDGRNAVRHFTNVMNDKLLKNKGILTDLTNSLSKRDFELYYQPLFTIDNKTLVGAEALIRWKHPDKGMILPSDFISIAEQSGLVKELGDWVLAQACIEVNNFIDAGIPRIKIAINISPVQFRRKDFIERMLFILAQHNISAECLELEITEGAVMDNIEDAIEKMQALHDAGFQLAMDDFGTGYSSLSYLKQFPIQKVKIDRSFISDIENDEDSKSITKAIIHMGHLLGLKVLAEGVETKGQLEYLQGEDCDYVQGYYTGSAMPASEFIKSFAVNKKGCTNEAVSY